MMYTRRPRLMTLHFSHIRLTEARTFIALVLPLIRPRSRVSGIGT